MSDQEAANRTDVTEQEQPGEDEAAPVSKWRVREPEDTSDPVEPIAHDSRIAEGWHLFGASRRGKSHAHAGTYREDAFSMAIGKHRKNQSWWALTVADGAGSCPLSRVGANLAVGTVCESLLQADRTGTAWLERLNVAVSEALTTLREESDRRECDLKDLSCTLLVLLFSWDRNFNGGFSSAFQAGDGLIACVDSGGFMEPMGSPDSEAFAGATHFLNSDYVKETWDSRFEHLVFLESPAGFLVMSDGVADDLVPYETNGPIIVRELIGIRDVDDPGRDLVEVLAYEKRGSFDDRTLVCALRSDRSFVEPDKDVEEDG